MLINLTAALNTNWKFPAFIWIFNDTSWKEVEWTYICTFFLTFSWIALRIFIRSTSTGSSLTKAGHFKLGDHLGPWPEDNFSCHAVGPWRSVGPQHVTVKQETVIIVITQGQMVRLTSQAWRQSLHDRAQNNSFDLRRWLPLWQADITQKRASGPYVHCYSTMLLLRGCSSTLTLPAVLAV